MGKVIPLKRPRTLEDFQRKYQAQPLRTPGVWLPEGEYEVDLVILDGALGYLPPRTSYTTPPPARDTTIRPHYSPVCDSYLEQLERVYDRTWLDAFAVQSLPSVAWRMLILEGCV